MDIRALNVWLKDNVPFYAKAARRTRRNVCIGCDIARDLTPYADAINREFNDSISRVVIGGLKNYITIVTR